MAKTTFFIYKVQSMGLNPLSLQMVTAMRAAFAKAHEIDPSVRISPIQQTESTYDPNTVLGFQVSSTDQERAEAAMKELSRHVFGEKTTCVQVSQREGELDEPAPEIELIGNHIT